MENGEFMSKTKTDWKKSWNLRCETNLAASEKRKLKQENHRRNRRIAKSEISHDDGNHNVNIPLDGWEVI